MTMTAASMGGGAHIVLVVGFFGAFWWFVVTAFGRRIGTKKGSSEKGGSEKHIVGVLWLLAAVIVGIAMGTGR